MAGNEASSHWLQMRPVKCPKMVVGATAKDVDMPEVGVMVRRKSVRALLR